MTWLRHPLREWARTVVGEERKTGPELDVLYEELGETYPFVSLRAPKESADAVLSAAVGSAEGAGHAIKEFVDAQLERSEPKPGSKIPLGRAATYSVRKASVLNQEGGQFLALAGVAKPPDPEATDRLIEQVTTIAKANHARIELKSKHAIPFPKLADFAVMGSALLGVNKGKDRVDEVRVVAWGGKHRDVEVHAFDKAGFHVLELGVQMESPGVLYIQHLQSSHGRNCDELTMAFGGGSVPGRGNAGLIAAGLEALIVEGAKAGLYAIATTPGSPQVQRLYEKMGFTAPGHEGPWRRRLLTWVGEKIPVVSGLLNAGTLYRQATKAAQGEDSETMILDLRDEGAVRQALVGFQLARSRFQDVPKNVAKKMADLGQAPDRPNVAQYRKQLPEGANNTRVLTSGRRRR